MRDINQGLSIRSRKGRTTHPLQRNNGVINGYIYQRSPSSYVSRPEHTHQAMANESLGQLGCFPPFVSSSLFPADEGCKCFLFQWPFDPPLTLFSYQWTSLPKSFRDCPMLPTLPVNRLGLSRLLQHPNDGSQLGLRCERRMLPLSPCVLGFLTR